MSLPRFFLPSETVDDGRVMVRGEELLRMRKVLRLRPGARVLLFDTKGTEHEAFIHEYGDGVAEMTVVRSYDPQRESPVAITLAQELKQRVLLADCDLRRGTVHKLLGFEPKKGLGDVLANGADTSTVVYETPITNLSVIPCGKSPENPSELLGSEKMRTLLSDIKTGFDICIFDTPPTLAITDAAVLASQVDGVILIGQAGKTPVGLVEESKEVLERAHANLLGFLLVGVNDPDPKHGNRYYRYVYEAMKGNNAK